MHLRTVGLIVAVVLITAVVPIEAQSLRTLDGDWELHWERYLYSDPGSGEGSTPLMVRMPYNVDREKQRYPQLSRYGFGSLRVVVPLENTGTSPLYLQIPDIPTAWRVWVNGRLRGSSGELGTDRASTVPQYLVDYYELDPSIRELEVVIEFANFHNHQASILKAPEVRDRRSFEGALFRDNFFPLLINGIFLFLFVYYLILYLMDRRYTEHLYFAIFVFSLLFRQLIIGGEISSIALYRIPWRWKYAVWQSMILLQLATFDNFIRVIFPHEASKRVSVVLVSITVAYTVFCLVTPAPVFTATLVFPQLIALTFGIYVHVVIGKAIVRRRERAWMLVVGSVILFTAVINDVLYSAGYLSTGRLLNFGALVFVLLQAALLARRFSTDVRDAARLTERLQAVNAVYARFVPNELPAALGKTTSMEIVSGDFSSNPNCALVFDLRDFTAISEQMTPAENFDFINELLAECAPIIRNSGGFITGFAGDQIRALFPRAGDGVDAAIKIQRTLGFLNQRRATRNQPPMIGGIGLAFGDVLIGAVGSTRRLQITTISDAFDRAMRLEEFTRHTDSLILCDQAVIAQCDEVTRLSARLLGALTVGSGQSNVYELIYSFMPPRQIRKLETKYLFERGVRALTGGEMARVGAREQFNAVLRDNPDDRIAAYYAQLTAWTAAPTEEDEPVALTLDHIATWKGAATV